MSDQPPAQRNPGPTENQWFYGGLVAILGAVLVILGLDARPAASWWIPTLIGALGLVFGLWFMKIWYIFRRR